MGVYVFFSGVDIDRNSKIDYVCGEVDENTWVNLNFGRLIRSLKDSVSHPRLTLSEPARCKILAKVADSVRYLWAVLFTWHRSKQQTGRGPCKIVKSPCVMPQKCVYTAFLFLYVYHDIYVHIE